MLAAGRRSLETVPSYTCGVPPSLPALLALGLGLVTVAVFVYRNPQPQARALRQGQPPPTALVVFVPHASIIPLVPREPGAPMICCRYLADPIAPAGRSIITHDRDGDRVGARAPSAALPGRQRSGVSAAGRSTQRSRAPLCSTG